MCKTISICLQKGGTGKTSTTTTIASILGSMGKSVLVIDMDSQNDISAVLGVYPPNTIYEVFAGKKELKEVIVKEKYFDFVAGNENIEIIENAPDFDNSALKQIIASVKNNYDYIFIDTPPALSRLLSNSLIASDYVIIPTDTRPLSFKAIDSLYETINSIRKRSNPNLKILGVLVVMYESRSTLNRQYKDAIQEKAMQYGTTIFDTPIRRGIALAESQTMQQLLIDYAPKSNVYADYVNATKEITQRIKGER